MKLPVSIIAAASIAVAGIAWTTPAQAATSNVGGWTPGTVTCANGRYLADHVPGAVYLELPGADHVAPEIERVHLPR